MKHAKPFRNSFWSYATVIAISEAIDELFFVGLILILLLIFVL